MAETVEIPQLRIVENIDETPEFDASTGKNPFAKVKGVITELISPLEEEDLDADTAKHSFKLETVVTHTVDGEIPMLQSELDALTKKGSCIWTLCVLVNGTFSPKSMPTLSRESQEWSPMQCSMSAPPAIPNSRLHVRPV